MILLDYHGFCISQIYGYSNFIASGKFDDDFFIERTLVKLGKLSKQHKKYGELVIACDSSKRKYWRTKEFEHYKASRYKEDDKSKLSPKDIETKQKLREIPYKLRDIIKDNFPFKIIGSEAAEADDIIGTLISYNFNDDHLILSADGDFVQLQRYKVKQYDSIRNRWLKSTTPDLDLNEKIIRGDTGDGIPNILSDADTLVNEGKKQKAMTKKKFQYLSSIDWDKMKSSGENSDLVDRYFQNKMLIDLSQTPLDVKEDIVEKYNNYEKKNSVMNFCLKNRYKFVFEHINLYTN